MSPGSKRFAFARHANRLQYDPWLHQTPALLKPVGNQNLRSLSSLIDDRAQEVPKHLGSILLRASHCVLSGVFLPHQHRFNFEPKKHLLLKTKSINFDRNLSLGAPGRPRMSRFQEAVLGFEKPRCSVRHLSHASNRSRPAGERSQMNT